MFIPTTLLDTGTPEFKGVLDTFMKRGTVVGEVRNDEYHWVDYYLDHPDFDSEEYGEKGVYDLILTKQYDGYNHNLVLKALKVHHDGKVKLVKDYTNNAS